MNYNLFYNEVFNYLSLHFTSLSLHFRAIEVGFNYLIITSLHYHFFRSDSNEVINSNPEAYIFGGKK